MDGSSASRQAAALLAAALACAAAGCSGGDAERAPGSADGPGPMRPARLISPSDGAVIRVPWVPLTAAIPGRFVDGPVRLTVDGREATDGFGTFAYRTNRPDAGRYIATLEMDGLAPGEHELRLVFGDPASGPLEFTGRFTWAPPPCEVELEVTDGAGTPVSARVALFRGGEPWLLVGPDAEQADPQGRDSKLHSLFVIGGKGHVALDPGEYEFLAVRGVRDDIARRSVTLGPDCSEPTRLRFELAEVVPTPGVVTADLHVHTGRSSDSHVPDLPRYRSLVAADLDVVVISDHNRITDPRRVLEAVRPGASGTRGIAGVEARVGPRLGQAGEKSLDAGHINVYPLLEDDALPPTESPDLAEHIDNFRRLRATRPHPASGAEVIVQLNHPRGLTTDPDDRRPLMDAFAYFNWRGFDRSVPLGSGVNAWLVERRPGSGTGPLDFDLLEIVNRFSWGPFLQVRADWFLLMQLAYFPTGVGNSDSHALAVELAGFPVNLVRTPRAFDERGELNLPAFLDALRAARVGVSTGPIVDLTVVGDGGCTGRPGDLVPATGGRVQVEVEVRAAPWVPVHEVRLVVNGEVARREALADPLPADGAVDRAVLSWTIDVERDSWILAEAGWPIDDPTAATAGRLGPYAEVVPGYVPLAFTNPVRADADGDEAWTPLDAAAAAAAAAPMP